MCYWNKIFFINPSEPEESDTLIPPLHHRAGSAAEDLESQSNGFLIQDCMISCPFILLACLKKKKL